MKIFTAEQIRQCEQYTVENEDIDSLYLMEKAAEACVDWIAANCKNHKNFAVFCGKGNNGGDGFAIATMLYLKGYDVEVFINDFKDKFSEEAAVNLRKFREVSGITMKNFKEVDYYRFDHKAIIIDAIFGTGLSRKIEGDYQELIDKLNTKKNIKISIDMPSGLCSDEILPEDTTVLKADYTLTFQFWKKSFLHSETGKYVGKVIPLDIDLDKDFISNTNTDYFIIEDKVVGGIFHPRSEFSHKGTYGRVTIIGGSYGKMGAVVLATKAALKSGSGLTFALAPKCGTEILQISNPEAMFVEGGDQYINSFDFEEDSVYGIGPGLGTHIETEDKILKFLGDYSRPLILDADALNIIAKNKKNLKSIPKNSIITPHPKEFERLFGETENSFKRSELAIKKAKELHIFIVLKDHHTQVITPEGKVYYNITGNAGLAKGGSGDILTGILTSLLAQGYSEENAAILGVWIHGKAADFAAEKFSKESMLPSDVINELGNVFEELNRKVCLEL
ncbi:NAD(P)H-hydrate dehydratase [Chryseobacterium nematophagum]|uniref:Bifunctional NAD(P)H-hydrate repair enzyme n=1 Tax=Chryseobacterium nematophagum TaxID=2305228 RepID=A0A3M7LAH7_9FLAO|nr:NAD(P)H-hydrate dehydratase [Chryseobacterium nematophagum]RMZ59758.1 NAD(P)H-hydrate dehydratase [Chryseobacterium nematophagum]